MGVRQRETEHYLLPSILLGIIHSVQNVEYHISKQNMDIKLNSSWRHMIMELKAESEKLADTRSTTTRDKHIIQHSETCEK
jgi:hypothetical protein